VVIDPFLDLVLPQPLIDIDIPSLNQSLEPTPINLTKQLSLDNTIDQSLEPTHELNIQPQPPA